MTDPTFPTEPRRFEPDAPAAIDPRALGRRWASWREAARVRAAVGPDGWPLPYAMVEGVAVVSVDGPLMQRGGYWWDGHDSVADRVKAALAEPKARAVVMKLNSPGGIAAGCFEAARVIRAAAQRSGKPLVAFADEMACSAAYALASAADRIYLPPSGEVGSVGVLSAVVSMKRAFDEEGIDAVVIRSGPRKALGHPLDPMSDAAVAAEQATVDALAAQFYALVASSRRMTADAVAALEGDVRMGASAVAAGLADGVMTFDEAIRAASSHASICASRVTSGQG
jgi:ClpP class serine protease